MGIKGWVHVVVSTSALAFGACDTDVGEEESGSFDQAGKADGLDNYENVFLSYSDDVVLVCDRELMDDPRCLTEGVFDLEDELPMREIEVVRDGDSIDVVMADHRIFTSPASSFSIVPPHRAWAHPNTRYGFMLSYRTSQDGEFTALDPDFGYWKMMIVSQVEYEGEDHLFFFGEAETCGERDNGWRSYFQIETVPCYAENRYFLLPVNAERLEYRVGLLPVSNANIWDSKFAGGTYENRIQLERID